MPTGNIENTSGAGNSTYEQHHTNDRIDARISAALIAHEDRQRVFIDSRMQELKNMFSGAFPDGDPSGHRAFHEAQIQLTKNKAEAWRSIRDKTFAGLIWSALGLIGISLLESAKAWFHSGGSK